MAKTIYVVYGKRGEYEYRAKWNVLAYSKKEDADKHATNAAAWSTGRAEALKINGGVWAWRNPATNPFDPIDKYPNDEAEYGVEELQYGN